MERLNVDVKEANINRIWLGGHGPILLEHEKALTLALGPNLWIMTAPMGRTFDYPLTKHLIAKLACHFSWGPLFREIPRPAPQTGGEQEAEWARWPEELDEQLANW
jgi:hypothetical protein